MGSQVFLGGNLMEPETLRSYVSENRELEKQLTKRNQQYIFDLKKSLEAANLSEEQLAITLHEMLPVLVQEQKGGKTARQLFGTVSERTESILSEPEITDEDTTPVLMWLDNVLFIFALFGAAMGLMQLISGGDPKTGQEFGLLTLVISSLIGGYAFYLMYKFFYQYQRPGADKSQQPKLWRSLLIMVPIFLIWVLALSFVQALAPKTINPTLNPLVMIVMGAAAFAIRWYLKKKFNIVGSLSVPRS